MKSVVAPGAAVAAMDGGPISPAFAIVESVAPQVDGGRFPAKRVVGEAVEVTASCFAHGHELVACCVRFRGPGGAWQEEPMEFLGNDRWSATFDVDRPGRWEYQVLCWVDHLTHWRNDFMRRVESEDIRLAAKVGAGLISRCIGPPSIAATAAPEATKPVAPGAASAAMAGSPISRLTDWAEILLTESDTEKLRASAADPALFELARAHAPRDGLAQ